MCCTIFCARSAGGHSPVGAHARPRHQDRGIRPGHDRLDDVELHRLPAVGLPASSGAELTLLTVVIPAYEEEGVIAETIATVRAHAAHRGWELEIVVAYSQGRDRTREVLETVLAQS